MYNVISQMERKKAARLDGFALVLDPIQLNPHAIQLAGNLPQR